MVLDFERLQLGCDLCGDDGFRSGDGQLDA